MEQREKLIELLSEHHRGNYAEAQRIADHLLTNGVTIPVLCKDCKHRGTDDCPMHIKGVPADEGFLKVVDNDFCSYGERRCADGTN